MSVVLSLVVLVVFRGVVEEVVALSKPPTAASSCCSSSVAGAAGVSFSVMGVFLLESGTERLAALRAKVNACAGRSGRRDR
jgi:hypothetical protein